MVTFPLAFLTRPPYNQFKCCGYFNSSDSVVIGGSFCQSQAFVNTLNTTITSNFCVTPITQQADSSLNDVFTYVRILFSVLETMIYYY
jgi:hypothetical protein